MDRTGRQDPAGSRRKALRHSATSDGLDVSHQLFLGSFCLQHNEVNSLAKQQNQDVTRAPHAALLST